METITQLARMLPVFLVLLSPIAGIWWWARHADEIMLPKYPDWIYGLNDTFRHRVALALTLFAIGYLWFLGFAGLESSGMDLLSLWLGSAVLGLVFLWAFRVDAREARKRRAVFEKTYDEGIEVEAEILRATETTGRALRLRSGARSLAMNTVAVAASRILAGNWTLRIRFELDGREVEDQRKVSSQAFYRFRDCETLPILVRPEAPQAWIPLLGERAVAGIPGRRDSGSTLPAGRRIPSQG